MIRVGRGPDLAAIERLAIAAWPALETASVDGWLWRYSGGGSKRANSTATVRFTGQDLDQSIDEIEQRYRAKGGVPRFQIFQASEPSGLDALLAARGYARIEPCLTMTKAVVTAYTRPAATECSATPAPAWLEVYLGSITPNRRAINRLILERAAEPRVYVSCQRDGQVISAGMGVVRGGLAIIECMATREAARRQGGAQSVLAGIEAWAAENGAHTICLQAVADNTPAIALYQRYGFITAGRYHFRVRGTAS